MTHLRLMFHVPRRRGELTGIQTVISLAIRACGHVVQFGPAALMN